MAMRKDAEILPGLFDGPEKIDTDAIMCDFRATMTQLDQMLRVHPKHGLAVLESSLWFRQLPCEYQQKYEQRWCRKAYWKEHDQIHNAMRTMPMEGSECLDGPYWCYLCGSYEYSSLPVWIYSEANPDFSPAHSIGPFSYADSASEICGDFNRRRIGFHLYRLTEAR